MSPRERADSRPTLYKTGNHAIANRRQISLREAILQFWSLASPHVTDDNRNFKIIVFSGCFFAPRENQEYSCLPYTVISTEVASLATYSQTCI